MNIEKFTQRSKEALMELDKVAVDFGNQEIEEEHLLYVLLNQQDSLIRKLIEKMNIDADSFTESVRAAVDARVKVSGGASPYIGGDLNKVLLKAPDEAKAMGDDYTSVEHLFLAMLKYPNRGVKELLRTYGITKDSFLQALAQVRGNQKVTTDNPEVTYDSLSKYGTDLVEKAEQHKLDPVIGRDDEMGSRASARRPPSKDWPSVS